MGCGGTYRALYESVHTHAPCYCVQRCWRRGHGCGFLERRLERPPPASIERVDIGCVIAAPICPPCWEGFRCSVLWGLWGLGGGGGEDAGSVELVYIDIYISLPWTTAFNISVRPTNQPVHRTQRSVALHTRSEVSTYLRRTPCCWPIASRTGRPCRLDTIHTPVLDMYRRS